VPTPLVSTTPTSGLTLPLSHANAVPQWIVPTQTTQLGASATLTLTITPGNNSGTPVSGVIYLDDSSSLSNNGSSPTADELAAFPYHYTVQ